MVQELEEQIQTENKEIIEDELGDEDEVVPLKYSISSYGADYVVDSLVKRLDREDIYIPPFQRKFIWSIRQSSRFIESLLLGLPIPSIFLSKDEENKLLVIDGQQRLRTLQYFYDGVFAHSGKEFALVGVQEQFKGKTYKTLSPEDRRQLDDSILHAIIVRQEGPEDDDNNTSMYFIFDRLNTTGTPLTSQEIRASLYRGEFNQLLEQLNQNSSWRSIYGRINKRRRDQEFILRFFALYFYNHQYSPPMKQFLNIYMSRNRHLRLQSAERLQNLFTNTINAIYESVGDKAFRPFKGFNAAVFDAVMVGVARRLDGDTIKNGAALLESYEALLNNDAFLNAIETGTTASTTSVTNRIDLATEAFQHVE